jgi:hypothetical protein
LTACTHAGEALLPARGVAASRRSAVLRVALLGQVARERDLRPADEDAAIAERRVDDLAAERIALALARPLHVRRATAPICRPAVDAAGHGLPAAVATHRGASAPGLVVIVV